MTDDLETQKAESDEFNPAPTLEDRVKQIRSAIDAIVGAEAVAKQSPGVPLGVIRNLPTARARVCRSAR